MPGESCVHFGRRRKSYIRKLDQEGVDSHRIADEVGVSHRYVLDALGVGVGRYEWRPPKSVLRGPFPTREEALSEYPLISENPVRMTTEQAIQRAVQMYRWLMAGMTMDEIGKKHGICRERVSKILYRFGFGTIWEPEWLSGDPGPTPMIIEHDDHAWVRVAAP